MIFEHQKELTLLLISAKLFVSRKLLNFCHFHSLSTIAVLEFFSLYVWLTIVRMKSILLILLALRGSFLSFIYLHKIFSCLNLNWTWQSNAIFFLFWCLLIQSNISMNFVTILIIQYASDCDNFTCSAMNFDVLLELAY